MTGTASDPANKSDLLALEERLKAAFDRKLAESNRSLLEEVKRHFDVVAENIRHDLEGANRDEISLITDTMSDHEKRLSNVEEAMASS